MPDAAAAPLAGVRVVVLGHALPLACASMLLGDLGADVVLVEDPRAPDAFDQAGPALDGLGAQRLAYGRNKRSLALHLALAPDREHLAELLRHADAVLHDASSGVAAAFAPLLGAAQQARPDLVTCDCSTWGSFGERANQPGCDLQLQAAAGCMDLTGEAGDPPTRAGIPLFDLVTGIYGAIAVLAALVGRQASGRGERIEVAGFDTAVTLLSNMASAYFANGEVRSRLGTGHISIFPYNAFRTADGEIVIAIFTQAFWAKFCAAIGRPDLRENPKYRSIADRMAAKDELSAILDALFVARPTADWAAALEAADVPYGPVLAVDAALALPQTLERGMVAALEGLSAPLRTVASPLRFRFADGTQYRPPARRAPRVGDSDAREVAAEWRGSPGAAAPRAGGAAALPLAGVRVLDFTRMFAGPWAAEILADLGATVTKVEEPRIGDPTRRHSPFVGEESSYFAAVNRGKRSVALDVRSDAGRAAIQRLVREADVVLENFRPGVMERLGLGHEAVLAGNPGLVFCSLSGFGADGPMRERISFDIVNQAFAGLIHVTGHPGRRAARIGVPIGDLSGGLYMAVAVLAALHHRRRTGLGCWIDLGLHDTLVSLLGDVAQRFFLAGAVPARAGNRHPAVAPHDAFETADGWLVLAAPAQPAWQALVGVLGLGAEEAAPFATPQQRLAAPEALQRLLQSRLRRQPTAHWLRVLGAAGIGCERVANMKEVLESSLLASRGLAYAAPVGGRDAFRLLASPMVFGHARLGLGTTPPRLGEHTAQVLAGPGP